MPLLPNPSDLTSHGYLHSLLHFIAQSHFGLTSPEYTVQSKTVRNNDLVEYRLVRVSDQETLLVFAKMYGLRNIQNLVRNSKKGNYKYSYIEVMSCPGGCLNGGGQLKSTDKNVKARDMLAPLSGLLQSGEVASREAVEQLVRQLDSLNLPTEKKAEFKSVGKIDNPQAIKW